MLKLPAHHISFKYAFEGWLYAFRTQPNFRIHTYGAIVAVTLGFLLGLTKTEWLILLLTIFLVFIVELINTSIEATSDLITTSHNPVAKAAKDTAAGAVLMMALCAVVVGYFLFWEKLLRFFGF
ncbi:MAG: hypothetical protein A3F33_00705 [Candidatus Woykebacteria bacterium RIFCSPHIGHO2_12_FULL_43_10]|uniref:Diacylglycerol kinase n=2 Tax=Candidatus Woykeibacteriota TaxID=1817899 RepID=A0A1G1WYF2_9BACT|nr:MAG: hypothetical protein A2802_02190 [Candidatus Woykebacteria bacterium RIFCSPHIGHO2_01_FULL_43_29]OGY28668.1 MAG: hypothetical protein A3F33_00705 [Candidatus Woykebacteria bacterium RIFCSPHIGHO2_12_FULL_43_10]OGY29703.1 MAG: hypothetical protein A3J50_02045 [Candidatus Woykebacteria bacterium RIFCSPHIGHO2_02_FULL_43_16b]OGY32786.1 MAG: hypothetical protein A3A61_03260 [Candidatus Woykebacteria bacterium RIFCSPLOWO2_01_FULL_43_14]